MRRFFDFSSSMSHFFGIPIYGSAQGKWWHSYAIIPLWKGGRTIHRRIMRLLFRFHPNYKLHIIDTGLKPGPYRGEKLILHASFSILMNSMKFRYGDLDQLETHVKNLQEAPIGTNPPDLVVDEVAFCKELLKLTKWWTVTRPSDLTLAKSLADLVYGEVHMAEKIDEETGAKSLEFLTTASENQERKKELRTLRKKIAHEEAEMLHRLIDMRDGLD